MIVTIEYASSILKVEVNCDTTFHALLKKTRKHFHLSKKESYSFHLKGSGSCLPELAKISECIYPKDILLLKVGD